MIVLESTFMFCSSMVVFLYITLGGVVGPDIRKMIRFKDLIFGCFLFLLVSSYYTYKFMFLPEDQRNAYDSHIVHLVVNMDRDPENFKLPDKIQFLNPNCPTKSE